MAADKPPTPAPMIATSIFNDVLANDLISEVLWIFLRVQRPLVSFRARHQCNKGLLPSYPEFL